MKPKVIFIDSVHAILEQRLTSAGFVCEHHYKTSRVELLKILPEYSGLVIRSRIAVDDELLEACPQLRFIARSGSGLENIDLDAAKERKIKVYNSPEGNRDAVGEHAIGMLLMLFNKLNKADQEVRNGIWLREENRGVELSGKTIGVLGYGNMGSSMAQKLSGFNCTVIAYDKYLENFSDSYGIQVSLETLFEKTDVLSLHLPLTEETTHFVDENFLDHFKKPIYLINTARGKNLDTKGLVASMKKGKVIGACLDVIEYEKASLEGLEFSTLPEELQYLYSQKNVVVSPHVAGWTVESYEKLSSVLADKILAEFRADTIE